MTGNQKTQQNKQVQKQNRVQKPKENVKHQFNSEQMRTAPETMRKDEVLVAQKQLGNQTVQRSFDHSSRSAQMTDEKGYLNKSISDTIQQKRGVGGALPITMQKEGEQNLGQNFSDVRIHTDASADNLSKQINAKAFTIGKDIFFRQGEYSPNTSKGRETLLHEMTHVVQQSGTPNGWRQVEIGRAQHLDGARSGTCGQEGRTELKCQDHCENPGNRQQLYSALYWIGSRRRIKEKRQPSTA